MLLSRRVGVGCWAHRLPRIAASLPAADRDTPYLGAAQTSAGSVWVTHRRAGLHSSVHCSHPLTGMGEPSPPPRVLPAKDRLLIQLFITGCSRHWHDLAPLAREYYAMGGTPCSVRATVRHILTYALPDGNASVAGYAPCLKSMLTLHRAELLGAPTLGKVGQGPGDAFELVYGPVAAAVRGKLHDADPVLAEWIQTHLYGDVYSSPGIDLRLKQLLLCAFLGEADMPDQLFGHVLAAYNFGASLGEVEEAMEIGFEIPQSQHKMEQKKEATNILRLAMHKFQRTKGGEPGVLSPPDVTNPAGSVQIPELYQGPTHRSTAEATPAPASVPERPPPAAPGSETASDAAPKRPVFAWEAIDERHSKE